MIVICTKCKVKFRIADERVGPRGAKVRCSRCQTVFLARREPDAPRPAAKPPPLPAPAAIDPSAEARGTPSRAPAPDPFAADDPFAPAADPFAPSGPDLFAVPAASDDPFRSPPASDDPFRGPPASPRPDLGDPFALASAPGTPAAAGAPPAGGPGADPFDGDGSRARLPLTDLADLLGPATPTPFPAPGAAPALGAAPPAALDHGVDGLSLEDRVTPAPVPVARGGPALDDVPGGGGDPFDRPAAGFDPGAFELGGGPEEPLALATDPAPALAAPLASAAWEAAPSLPAQAHAPRGAVPGAAEAGVDRARPPAPPAAKAPAAAPAGRVPGGRGSRIRAAAVNAVALAALLLAALAILVVWRAEGRLEAAAFRPAAIVRALRPAGAEGSFSAQGIRSGLYEREKGPPFLFVRGEVVSRAQAPVPAVRVKVELLRDGRVIGGGAALAGAVPTPEELHRAADAAALERAARAAAARVPAEVRPGDAVPFLVTIADHPAELAGASVRIAVEAAERAR